MSSFKKNKNEKFQKQTTKMLTRKRKPNIHNINKKDLDELKINSENDFISKKEIENINQENYEVIKDNRLIQKATYDFTELELKCLNFTLSKLKPNKTYTENDTIEYPLKELYNMLKFKHNSSSIELLKDSLHNLRTKGKWVHIQNKKENSFVDLSFFLKCKIELNENNENVVKIKFMQEILDYLQNLKKNFTSELLVYTMRLKGKYSIRLYELCKSYQSMFLSRYKNKEYNFYGFAFVIDLVKTKWVLPDYYRSADIKRLLNKAIVEVNDKTDIKISIQDELKEKQKTTEFIFKVEPNNNFTKIYQDIERERNISKRRIN